MRLRARGDCVTAKGTDTQPKLRHQHPCGTKGGTKETRGISATRAPYHPPPPPGDLSRFSPRFERIQYLTYKMQDLRNFVLDNYIPIFDAEQVYFKPQVTNFTNKEVTADPKPQHPPKKLVFRKP